MKLFTVLLLISLTGCATLREREEADPGHGAFSFILEQVVQGAEMACTPMNVKLAFDAVSLTKKVVATTQEEPTLTK